MPFWLDMPPNWRREERAIRSMCESWLAKHPEVQSQQEQTVGEETNRAKTQRPSLALPLRWHGEVDPAESRAWLVNDLLPETGKGLISGQWGLYKSFVAIDLSAAVMAGASFIEFEVLRPGGVLFIAAEGASDVPARLQAVLEGKYNYPRDKRAPFTWSDICPRLLDQRSVDILVATAKDAATRMQSEFGMPLTLVLVDTVVAGAGYSKSGEENDAAAGQVIMNVLGRVAQSTGTLALGVDHFGKDQSTGTRGTSAKEAAADVVLALLGTRSISGEVADCRLAVRKVRSGPTGQEFAFTVRSVDIGIDRYGAQLTSLMIDWSNQPVEKSAKSGEGWSKSLRLLRQVLMNVLVDHGSNQRPFPDGPVVRAVDVDLVRREFCRSYVADGNTPAKRQAPNAKRSAGPSRPRRKLT